MDQLVSRLLSFIGTTLMPGGYTSPREDVLLKVLSQLLNPPPPVTAAAHYIDNLKALFWIAVILFVVQFVVALVRGVVDDNLGGELKEVAKSGIFLFVLVPALPAMLTIFTATANELARWFVLGMLNNRTPQEFASAALVLSGNPMIDFSLSILQMGLLLVMYLCIIIVPLAGFLSGILLMLGYLSRNLGQIGDSLLQVSLSITLYGTIGSALMLVVYGISVGLGHLFYPDNPLALALINTAAILAAVIAAWVLLRRMRGKIRVATDAIKSRGTAKLDTSDPIGVGVNTTDKPGNKSASSQSWSDDLVSSPPNQGGSDVTGPSMSEHREATRAARSAPPTPPAHKPGQIEQARDTAEATAPLAATAVGGPPAGAATAAALQAKQQGGTSAPATTTPNLVPAGRG